MYEYSKITDTKNGTDYPVLIILKQLI